MKVSKINILESDLAFFPEVFLAVLPFLFFSLSTGSSSSETDSVSPRSAG